MSLECYNYQRQAIAAARELYYPDSVIEQLKEAKTEFEIACIMTTARKKQKEY